MAGRIAGSLSVLVLAAFAAPAARAMDDGWYFEVAMGQASFTDASTSDLATVPNDLFFDQYAIEFVTQSVKLQSSDRSYAIITGYRFNRYLSMETGYVRMGAVQYTATGTVAGGSQVPATFNFSFRAKGVLLGVAGTWPLNETLELRGRGGISSSDTRVKYVASVLSSQADDQWSASSQDVYAAVGVGAYLRKYYRVGLDWMFVTNMGKRNLTYYDTNVSNIMLSFSYLY